VTVKRFAHVWSLFTSPTKETVADPVQLSEAVMLPGVAAGTWLAHCTVRLLGHVIVGGVLSAVTVNVDMQVDVTGGHALVYVKVTFVEPPQARGAPVLLLDNIPLSHPPPATAVPSQWYKLYLFEPESTRCSNC
jgi:hypothetical protein